MDRERLEELAASIREHGIIEPIVVRRGSGAGTDHVSPLSTSARKTSPAATSRPGRTLRKSYTTTPHTA